MKEALNWWQEKVVYQIYPRSFCDFNGDGIGDIKGIISKLDYLKQLGIGIIWLSPMYVSPKADNGYDIADYYNIDPQYGTMADMEELIEKAKAKGLKIILDLVVNHTSDEHKYFIESMDKASPYRDYYIWRQGKRGGKAPPNNWTSFFGGKAWSKDSKSGEWYLHLFSPKQPDLNWHNPKVVQMVREIMRFWLDKGIAGFRCDVINLIYKTSLADGKKRLILTGSEHYLTQDGCHKTLADLRQTVLNEYDCFTVGETVFITPMQARKLCGTNPKELDMVFNFEHMEVDQFIVKWFKRKFKPEKLINVLDKWQNQLDWNALYLENHDQPRSVSRFGNNAYWDESAKMLGTLLLTLRGTPYIFQGQEIGMTNFDFTDMSQIQDVESHNIYNVLKKLPITKRKRWKMIKRTSRDNARTPMQWDGGAGAGFTAGTPWIGINSNHSYINVAAQNKLSDSVLEYYKKLIKLRSEIPALRHGTYTRIAAPAGVYCYERILNGERYIIVLNMTAKKSKFNIDFKSEIIASNYSNKDYNKNILLPYYAMIIKPKI